jgi:hypothetical protein
MYLSIRYSILKIVLNCAATLLVCMGAASAHAQIESFTNTTLTASLDPRSDNSGTDTFWTIRNSTTDTPHDAPIAFSLRVKQPKDEIIFPVSKGVPAVESDLFLGSKAIGLQSRTTVDYTSTCPGMGGGNSGNLATPEPSGKYLSAIVAAAMLLIVIGRKKLLCA